MGLILTTVKIVAGTKIAKNVLNSAYEKITNDENMQKRIQSVKDLREKNICPNCGYVLHFDENFCPNCGATLNEKKVLFQRTLHPHIVEKVYGSVALILSGL